MVGLFQRFIFSTVTSALVEIDQSVSPLKPYNRWFHFQAQQFSSGSVVGGSAGFSLLGSSFTGFSTGGFSSGGFFVPGSGPFSESFLKVFLPLEGQLISFSRFIEIVIKENNIKTAKIKLRAERKSISTYLPFSCNEKQIP